MPDRFANIQAALYGPASSGFAITPSDIAELPETTRAIYVGGGGNITLRMLTGETLALANVPGGTILPVRATGVLATGTTTSALVGLV